MGILADYKSIAEKHKVCNRLQTLLWEHHRIVAPLPVKERMICIKLIIDLQLYNGNTTELSLLCLLKNE